MNSSKFKLRTLIFILTLSLAFFPSHLFSIDSLSYKIGQMVIEGYFPNTDMEDTILYDIEHRNLGGVILLEYNCWDRNILETNNANLQSKADTPLFICIDQEGGWVARLNDNNGFDASYDAHYLGSLNSETTTRNQAAKMGGWLSDMGINVNFAPVADLNINPDSPAIGRYNRSFSANPHTVTDHCYWYYDEFKKKELVATLKHFPGHGSAIEDTHNWFADITDTWSKQELIPYKALIDSGFSDIVMTGHLYNSTIDSNNIATFSYPTLTGILRDSLGFNGIIITDDMLMNGVIAYDLGFNESVIRAIEAGVDMLLYNRWYWDGSSYRSPLNLIVEAVQSAIDTGRITESRIDESYDRIMEMKAVNNTAVRPIIADEFNLKAYPNPFNPVTKISFHIEDEIYETAQLNIFSIDGRLIQRYFIQLNGAGTYDVTWNAKDLCGKYVPSGTYIYGLKINNELHTGKMTLLK